MLRKTLAIAILAACGGSKTPAATTTTGGGGDGDMDKAMTGGGGDDPNAAYGPLDVGADYETYKKVSKAPFMSKTHGGRFVEVWINETAYAAYTGEADFPPGSVLVKTSWEADGDKPSATAGPIFVMKKGEPGSAPEHEDWYYALHWAAPTPKFAKSLGGPTYWRSPSAKVDYCWKCHENYDRDIGGTPAESRTW